MDFENFIHWLKKTCSTPRKTNTLGGQSSFIAKIGDDGKSLSIKYGKNKYKKNSSPCVLTFDDLKLIWKRYWQIGNRKHNTKEYNLPEWDGPDFIGAPYVPALIRDFEKDFQTH